MKIFAYTITALIIIISVWQIYASNSNKNFDIMDNLKLSTIDDIEFRVYAQYSTISVPLNKKEISSADGKFSVLANYIFGGNKESQKIAMTSPVIYEMEESSYFSFLVPESLSGTKLPTPNDPSIEFHNVYNQHVAVITFGGFSNEKTVKKHHDKLKKKLIELGFSIGDNYIVAVYQPPYQMLNRKNEIWIEINKEEYKNIIKK